MKTFGIDENTETIMIELHILTLIVLITGQTQTISFKSTFEFKLGIMFFSSNKKFKKRKTYKKILPFFFCFISDRKSHLSVQEICPIFSKNNVIYVINKEVIFFHFLIFEIRQVNWAKKIITDCRQNLRTSDGKLTIRGFYETYIAYFWKDVNTEKLWLKNEN